MLTISTTQSNVLLNLECLKEILFYEKRNWVHVPPFQCRKELCESPLNISHPFVSVKRHSEKFQIPFHISQQRTAGGDVNVWKIWGSFTCSIQYLPATCCTLASVGSHKVTCSWTERTNSWDYPQMWELFSIVTVPGDKKKMCQTIFLHFWWYGCNSEPCFDSGLHKQC